MAGPPRPHQHFELDEDIRPLTGTGSGRAARRRHLGPTSFIQWNVSREKVGALCALMILGAVYMLGKEKGQSLRFGGLTADVDRKPPQVNRPSTPTYQPTEKGTDPPVPTYDPTKAGTLPPTPRPTLGNTSFVPSPNPYIEKFNTTEWQTLNSDQWNQRYENSMQIAEKYGTYCPKDPLVPMCPVLNGEQKIANEDWKTLLEEGPTVECMKTGDKTAQCGVDNPWLNKTIWPLIRGPFCYELNSKRSPMPDELLPYHELGYDRADPTKSTDAAPFDGGAGTGNLWFDANKVKEHFLKFEAMLDYYYEGLSRPLLEDAIKPLPESPLYAPMLQQYADQISRALLRRKDNGDDDDGIVIGILGDSVTSGTDNCYFDAWPEQFRRQLAPLLGSMGLKLEIRNAAKNGGWLLAPQMLCANDMLGGSDRKNDVGLDFLFQLNPFVRADDSDAEHLIRRSLFGEKHTLVGMVLQNNMKEVDFLNRYSSAGFTVINEPSYKLPEFHFPIPKHTFWFPEPGRAFWGMQSDGFCRLSTRAGSAPVVKRNWHWGPLVHQTFADALGLLFSRAFRLAVDDLAAGRIPPEPPSIDDYKRIIDETNIDDAKTQIWKKLLVSDMASDEYANEGMSGVHCAVGSANQPGSTLLKHWLKPADGSPFEDKMKSRAGTSFVPLDHDSEEGSTFYRVGAVISPPNNAVEIGDWVANPNKFNAEAPRTREQCLHVDGQTMVNFDNPPDGISWVTWQVPARSISIGRIMICQPRAAKKKLAEDAFNTKAVRFHYAVPDASNNWKVVEDTQKNEYKKENDDCTVIVNDMDSNDKAAAWTGGLWVAVEWKKENIFEFDYLVVM